MAVVTVNPSNKPKTQIKRGDFIEIKTPIQNYRVALVTNIPNGSLILSYLDAGSYDLPELLEYPTTEWRFVSGEISIKV